MEEPEIESQDLPPRWRTVERCGCCGASTARPAGSAQGVELARCLECGTLRFRRIVDPELVYRDGYHTGDADFGWNYAGDQERAYEEALAHRRLDWLERVAGHRSRLLDVGGGVGFFAGAANERGWDAELLEPVADAADHARRLGVRVRQAGVEELGNVDGRYHVVTFVHSLEHFEPAREILETAQQVLAPDGVIYVEVPHHGSLARRLQGDKWLGWQAGEHVYVFTRKTISDLIRRAGLEIVAAGTFVPGWRGLTPDGYAHFLGLQQVMGVIVRARRRRHDDPDSGPTQAAGPVPRIDELTGVRRAIFGPGFDALARLEQWAGVGTNVRIIARPAPLA